jgi:hypothetical protein
VRGTAARARLRAQRRSAGERARRRRGREGTEAAVRARRRRLRVSERVRKKALSLVCTCALPSARDLALDKVFF